VKKLHSLEPAEVSLVPRGANKKKFLALKSADGNPMTKEDLHKMISCDPETMKRVGKIIKDYNDGCGVAKDKLTTEGREHVAGHNFAEPKDRKYPIEDEAHARNALARVSQHGTPEEKKKVEAAVYAKYPGLKARHDEAKKAADMPNNEQLGQGPLDEKGQAALQAVVRILNPMKETLSPVLLRSVLDAAGFQLDTAKSHGGEMDHEMEQDEMEKSSRMSPEKVKEEHHIAAMKVAKDAYKAELAKLGYQKYPTEQISQKAVDHDPDEPGQDLEQEGLMHDPDKEGEGEMQHKSGVMKSLLAGVPKESRGAIEAIFKAHEETKMRLEAVTKAARHKEFVEKAAGYRHLGVATEELAVTLEALPTKQLEVVEKMLKAADEQISKGKLYAEFGTNQPNPAIMGPEASWANIQKAAHGYVAKSGEKLSDAEAMDKFIQTPEGKNMYNQYQEELRAAARRA
jgi:hypothetical protein